MAYETQMTYEKRLLIECGWNKSFVAAISDDDAERLLGIEDPDDQIRYAEGLNVDYEGDGLWEV